MSVETYSAGTYDYKIVDCSCSGDTVYNSPHPVYTDDKGNNVIQLTSVTIGGFNGLNN
jgi:hypothetical protein